MREKIPASKLSMANDEDDAFLHKQKCLMYCVTSNCDFTVKGASKKIKGKGKKTNGNNNIIIKMNVKAKKDEI